MSYVDGDIKNASKLAVSQMVASMPQPRRGTVQSFDPARMLARVLIEPEGLLSGWIPVLTPMAAAGHGVLAAPEIGAQVVVLPVDGSAQSFVVLGAHFSVPDPPPAGYAVGDILLITNGGGSVHVTAAGAITVAAPGGAQIALATNGTITVTGNVTVNGALTVSQDATINGITFSAHQHSGVTSGGVNTGAPVAGT